MLSYIRILFVILTVSLSQLVYAESGLGEKVSGLGFKLSSYETKDRQYLYAVNNIVDKGNVDGSGATARLSLLHFDTEGDTRKSHYISLILDIISMVDLNDQQDTVEAIKLMYGLTDGSLKTISVGSKRFDNLIEISTKDKNIFLTRVFRSTYLKSSKYTSFKNVRNRLDKVSVYLKKIGKTVKAAEGVVAFSKDVLMLIAAMEIDTGFMLDNLDVFEKYSKEHSKDKLLLEAIKEVRSRVLTRNDEFLSKIYNVIYDKKTDFVTLDYLLNIGISTISGKIAASFLAGSQFSSFLISFAVLDLKQEYVDSPSNVKDHFLITTILYDIFKVNPVDRIDVADVGRKISNGYSSDEGFIYAKLRGQTLIMFYNNMLSIMDDVTFTEKLIKINPLYYYSKLTNNPISINIDRSSVKKKAKPILQTIKTIHNSINVSTQSLSAYLSVSDNSNKSCNIFNPYSETYTIKIVSNNDIPGGVEWKIYGYKNDGLLKLEHKYTGSSSVSFTPDNNSEYTKYLFVSEYETLEGKHIKVKEDLEIYSKDTTLQSISFTNNTIQMIPSLSFDKKGLTYGEGYLRELGGGVGLFLHYSDGRSNLLNEEVINKCKNLINIRISNKSVLDINSEYVLQAKSPGSSSVSVSVNEIKAALNVKVHGYFSDVPEDSWVNSYLNKLAEVGIVQGETDGIYRKFYPTRNILRSEFIKMLVHSNGYDCNVQFALCNTPPFTYRDITTNHWFFNDVMIAYNLGWLDKTKNMFNPTSPIKRSEAIKLIIESIIDKGNVNIDLSKNELLPVFDDVLNKSDWFYKYINSCHNLLLGKNKEPLCRGHLVGNKNLFYPNKYISRAETAKLVCLASGVCQ